MLIIGKYFKYWIIRNGIVLDQWKKKKFVCAEDNGRKSLVVNRSSASKWEKFNIIKLRNIWIKDKYYWFIWIVYLLKNLLIQ